ncbi:hypothetical protein CQ12_22005 [Bradyrhizobium jicamae]|uniref:Uncharacterized protein n=1 Tax=Bradyrhizobium jicamae TaxID=280332 RepID=A0A0R3M0Q9_9BRAD|nr:hypothetical protein CQ12_22005 [Bradyrhizobium jicamae]
MRKCHSSDKRRSIESFRVSRNCSTSKVRVLAFEAIASTLCDRHFLRQFFVTHDPYRDRRASTN